jgi:plastocyanin
MSRIALLGTSLVAAAALVAPSAGVAMGPTKLTGVTGPGFTISLKKRGVKVRTLKAGRYTITVTDKSRTHNFRLKGPGLNRQITTLSFRGTRTITVRLQRGRYTYLCDPHAAMGMKGTVRVT